MCTKEIVNKNGRWWQGLQINDLPCSEESQFEKRYRHEKVTNIANRGGLDTEKG